MSEREEFAGLARAAVAEQSRAIAEDCAERLSGLLSTPVSARASDVVAVRKDGVAEDDSPLMHQLCRTAGERSHPVHILATRESAGLLAGHLLEKQPEEIEALCKQELDSEGRTAFQEAMKAVAACASQKLAGNGLPEIEVRDAREVPEPASDPTWLDGDGFVRLRLELTVGDESEARIDVLLPLAENEDGDSSVRLIFVEACPDEFDRLDVIATDVGFEMVVSQPHAFLEDLEGASDASVIVIPWELAGRSGLELVETLRNEEMLDDVAFAMASDRPTREQVAAARRAGAATFLRRPYERAEIESRLVGSAPVSETSGAETMSDGAG